MRVTSADRQSLLLECQWPGEAKDSFQHPPQQTTTTPLHTQPGQRYSLSFPELLLPLKRQEAYDAS